MRVNGVAKRKHADQLRLRCDASNSSSDSDYTKYEYTSPSSLKPMYAPNSHILLKPMDKDLLHPRTVVNEEQSARSEYLEALSGAAEQSEPLMSRLETPNTEKDL